MSDAEPQEERRAPEHFILLGIALLAIAGTAALGLLVEPDPRGFGTHEQLGMAPCRTMDLVGIPCPGCGVTTSVSLLWHGEPWASFLNQPFGFLLGLLVPLIASLAIYRHLRGADLYADALKIGWGKPLLGFASVMVVAWIYKVIQL